MGEGYIDRNIIDKSIYNKLYKNGNKISVADITGWELKDVYITSIESANPGGLWFSKSKSAYKKSEKPGKYFIPFDKISHLEIID